MTPRLYATALATAACIAIAALAGCSPALPPAAHLGAGALTMTGR